MGKHYSDEVSAIPESIVWALKQDVSKFERSLQALSDENVITIGSGGSFSVASYGAMLHERCFGRLARPATPLEMISQLGTSFKSAKVFFSAEGRNKDILAAAQMAQSDQGDALALTLTQNNPLVENCRRMGNVQCFSYEMPWQKDGYLATNSLVAMMVIIAKAYCHVDQTAQLAAFDSKWITKRREWFANCTALDAVAKGAQATALFGKLGRIGAIDLESKFAESAIGSCQVVDYRQFAHGRHLQLIKGQPQVVIAFGSEADERLVNATLALVPANINCVRLLLPSNPIIGEIVGVIESILLIEALAMRQGIDVGQPHVQQFGRAMYAMDVRNMYDEHFEQEHVEAIALARKAPSKNRTLPNNAPCSRLGVAFCDRLKEAIFRGVVCDFDGTCCNTSMRHDGLDHHVAYQIERLLSSGVRFAFASGRGKSLQKDLRAKLSKHLWSQVVIGNYSGSSIVCLDSEFVSPPADSRLEILRDWLLEHGMAENVNQINIRGGQLGLSADSVGKRALLLSAIRHWIAFSMYDDWRVFCSGHSVDVLTKDVSKSKVVHALAMQIAANETTELLRIGDSGQFEGNDFELLSDGLGLSVEKVSPLHSSCWNLLPKGVCGATGMTYYLESLEVKNGRAVFSKSFISQAKRRIGNSEMDR